MFRLLVSHGRRAFSLVGPLRRVEHVVGGEEPRRAVVVWADVNVFACCVMKLLVVSLCNFTHIVHQ